MCLQNDKKCSSNEHEPFQNLLDLQACSPNEIHAEISERKLGNGQRSVKKQLTKSFPSNFSCLMDNEFKSGRV